MKIQVTKIEQIAQDVKSFEFRGTAGEELAPFEAGGHLELTLEPGLKRPYSLVSDPSDLSHYSIAVLLHPGGRGSTLLHERLQLGEWIEADAPKNSFGLQPATHTILIAGGIGVTPIRSHSRELQRNGASYEIHYTGRGRERMAMLDALGGRVTVYDSKAGEKLNVEALLATPQPGTRVYVCGPGRLIDAVRSIAAAQGWAPEQIHFESFGATTEAGDQPVELELRRSKIKVTVPVGKSLLEAIEEAGGWVPWDCKQGECRTCVSTVLEGEPVHRDLCLSEKDHKTLITPCVSWAKGGRLVLDI